jgi:hypothetical protein
MNSNFRFCALLVLAVALSSGTIWSQPLKADGKFGLSFLTGNGSSSAILFGGAVDIPLDNKLFVRPELNITTHPGTPIEMAGEIKYFLPSQTHPELYLDGGLGIWFYSGGTALGFDFGGGALFPIQGSSLVIPAEIRLGPIFQSGSSVFQIALTSGVRFSLK